MPTPILRNPYASQVKPHQKQHPVYTLYKPFYIKKKRSSGGMNPYFITNQRGNFNGSDCSTNTSTHVGFSRPSHCIIRHGLLHAVEKNAVLQTVNQWIYIREKIRDIVGIYI